MYKFLAIIKLKNSSTITFFFPTIQNMKLIKHKLYK